jgi:hypothetical protein
MAERLAANPPPERPSGQKQGRIKQSPARNLRDRLWMGEDAVLGIWAFLHDLRIPFDNNQAEQDRRRLKVHHTIAGSFRAQSGSHAFARIRGDCATLRKQGMSLFAALPTVSTGQPLSPTLGYGVSPVLVEPARNVFVRRRRLNGGQETDEIAYAQARLADGSEAFATTLSRRCMRMPCRIVSRSRVGVAISRPPLQTSA